MKFHLDQKIAGVLMPLFALRGKKDLGIGDTSAMMEAVVWARKNGFHVLQLLPINESGASNSPYSLISAMALEPSTITTDPEWIPELQPETYAKILASYDLAALQNGPVNYPLVRKLKRELLTAAWKNFSHYSLHANKPLVKFAAGDEEQGAAADRQGVYKAILEKASTSPTQLFAPTAEFQKRFKDYQDFQEEHASWLPRYTLYRTLLEQHEENDNLSSWAPELRDSLTASAWLEQLPAKEKKDFEERRDFFTYVQWIAFRQWQKIFSFAEEYKIALIGDIPTGVNLGSADVFSNPELFDVTTFGGAPPEKVFRADPFTMQWGQNWGIPLYRWKKMAEDNFSWWRHRLRHLHSLFHFLRIDHALGLFRIYSFPWKPERDAQFINLSAEEVKKFTDGRLPHFIDYDDDTPEHRTYNQQRGERLLQFFLEEVGKNNLIAEDLGEVPPYVPESLAKLEIPGFKIPLWTRNTKGVMLAAQEYPKISVATYATHDHEPLRKQWERWQAESQREGTSSGGWKTLKEMLTFIDYEQGDPMAPYLGDIHEQLLKGLYATNSWLTIVMITDLFGSTQQFNVPGSPSIQNWCERIALPISEWNKNYQKILSASYEALKKNNRLKK